MNVNNVDISLKICIVKLNSQIPLYGWVHCVSGQLNPAALQVARGRS